MIYALGWRIGSLLSRRCYTAKRFVQLVSQCFGDIVGGQVARNISQCNIPCNGQRQDKLQEPLPKVELSSTFRAACLAMILAVAGYVAL